MISNNSESLGEQFFYESFSKRNAKNVFAYYFTRIFVQCHMQMKARHGNEYNKHQC